MKKKILYFFSSIFLIFILFLAFDYVDVDTKYVNRSVIEFDRKNLNSRHTKKIANYLRYSYLKIYKIIDGDGYEDRWGVEKSEERLKLNKIEPVKIIKKNFSKSLYETSEYETSNNWYRSHGNNFSTRFSSISLIKSENANDTKLAWVYEPKNKTKYTKNIQANPIYFDGSIYTPNSVNQIVSLNPKDGSENWVFDADDGIVAKRGLVIFDPKKNQSLPTAVAQKQHNPRIFFTTGEQNLFCLDAYTGELIKSFGKDGRIKVGLTPIPPVIYKDNLIIVDQQSRLSVYDLFSGKIKWKYKINKDNPDLLLEDFYKGSPWGGFSLDEKRGLFFFTTGNPEYWHVGIDRPGDNLYGNSIVAFDLNKKKIKWHFQETPHDLWNMDLAAPPILTTVKKDNRNVDVVVVASKSGNTFVLDRDSGLSLFEIFKERSPVSNVPGEKTSPYQLKINLPEPICVNKMNKNLLSDLSYVDKKRLEKQFATLETGFPNPPKIGKKNIQLAGCVRWAGASVDTKNNIMYVSTDQQPYLVSIIKHPNVIGQFTHKWEKFLDEKGFPAVKPPWGSIVALNLNSGKIIWKVPFGEWESLKNLNIKKTGTFNRSGITASSGDVIFASGTQDKKFYIINSVNGDELWSYKMSHPGSAPPLIFEDENKQYIIVPAFESGGKKIYAFKLEEENQ